MNRRCIDHDIDRLVVENVPKIDGRLGRAKLLGGLSQALFVGIGDVRNSPELDSRYQMVSGIVV
jgi:hypothetical protein